MEQIDRSGLKKNTYEIAEVAVSNRAFPFAFYIKTPFLKQGYTLLGG